MPAIFTLATNELSPRSSASSSRRRRLRPIQGPPAPGRGRCSAVLAGPIVAFILRGPTGPPRGVPGRRDLFRLRVPDPLVVPAGLHPVAARGHRAPAGRVGPAVVDEEQAAFIVRARAQPPGVVSRERI